MTDAEFLRNQAQRCRWLAGRITSGDVAQSLIELADEYERRAERMERGEEASEA
jgi:hypothetical protein